jgi:DNA modification methylase
MVELDIIHAIDCLKGLQSLPDNIIQCCVTSPPYWRQRDYQMEGQYGTEDSIEAYVCNLKNVFAEVYRILKPDGTLWLNLGDAYWGSGKAGNNEEYQKRHTEFGKPSKEMRRFGKPTNHKHPYLKPKDLIGLPWMIAFALRNEGWYFRQDIIWFKSNCMPESVKDRCTKAHEYIFLFSKSPKYYFNTKAIKELAVFDNRKDIVMKGSVKYKQSSQSFAKRGHIRWQLNDSGDRVKNKRSVWVISTASFNEAHFATFPELLPYTCLLAGTKKNSIVLDPFMGAGTTALVAKKLNRHFIGFELNPQYVALANKRLKETLGLFYHSTN